jgi:hypothetical protein
LVGLWLLLAQQALLGRQHRFLRPTYFCLFSLVPQRERQIVCLLQRVRVLALQYTLLNFQRSVMQLPRAGRVALARRRERWLFIEVSATARASGFTRSAGLR